MKQQQLLELYDNYSDNAFRLAMSFLGNIADSEDIVQNVYTKLIEKSPHTMNKRKYNIYNSDIIDLLNNNSFCNQKIKLIYADPPYTNRLPDTYRTALYLHYYEGYSFKEIAKMLHLSVSAVSMRISRGRDQLKEFLKEE